MEPHEEKAGGENGCRYGKKIRRQKEKVCNSKSVESSSNTSPPLSPLKKKRLEKLQRNTAIMHRKTQNILYPKYKKFNLLL